MFLADYHLHTSFSPDSEAPMEAMILTAINKGLSEIAITDHVDFDFKHYTAPDYDAYIPYFNDLKAKYQDKISIILGAEIGLENNWADNINDFTSKYSFDFIIGSSHSTSTMDLYFDRLKYFENKSKKQAYSTYFEEMLKNINTCNDFNVYGHLDFISRYGIYEDNSLNYSDYADIIDQCLTSLISKNKGIEINTSGFKYGINDNYPSVDIIKRYKELGGSIITVGSDSHNPEYVGSHIDAAYQILKNAGYNYVTTFKDQKPNFVKI